MLRLLPKKNKKMVLSSHAVPFPPSLPFPFVYLLTIVNHLFPWLLLVELRYHLELSKVAYKGSSDYSEVVDRIQTLQRLLGDLQDLQLLALSLQKRFGSLKKLPTLAAAIYKQYKEVSV